MDLRTIMNSDAAGGANNDTPPLQRSPIQQSGPETLYHHQQSDVSPSGPPYQAGYSGRPPHPPLQPPHRSPDGSSSYASAQSPYRYNSVSSLSGGPHSQHGQSPAQSSPSYPSVSRDAYIANSGNNAVYNQQPPGPLASPYTPQPISAGQHQQQQSYFSHQRSQSILSVLSPSSSYSYSYPRRESPHSAGSQQVFPPQQFSPQAQRSQPGTPLGPPSTSYQRASPQATRPQSSSRDSQHTQLSSPWGAPETHVREQRSITSPIAQTGPSRQDSRSSDQGPIHYPSEVDRERSVSVSPKTIVSSTPRQASVAGSQERTSPPNRNSMEEGRRRESPTGPAFNLSHGGAGATSSTYQSTTPQPSYTAAAPHTNSSPSSRVLSSTDVPSGPPQKPDSAASSGSGSSSQPPKRKRMRYEEPPIYARKATRTSGRSPVIPNPRPPVPKHARHLLDERFSTQQQQQQPRPIPRPAAAAAAAATAAAPPSTRSQANGVVPTNGRPVPAAPPEPSHGPLGPWEPSITGLIPHEEITKLICDFLFQQVVMRKDIGAAPAGAAATGQGAILEVEAKLGQLVDKNRGERLRLPVMTECIINRDDPNIRTSFESSMTLAQHRAMNNFLNEAVKASMSQANSNRIPLSYAHKKERDTFYEISPSELPPIIQHNLHPRHKPKVRVTTDQRTGEILAKIVKCRIADLDVYSPRTHLDWRVSVNLEMNYDGDVRHLAVSDGGGARGRAGGERNKDRMSYRHLAYQIDLTQVATAEPPTKSDFEHELEIEVSAAEVRRQGDLALAGDPKNQYEELIKGFVDNIRVLARAVPGS